MHKLRFIYILVLFIFCPLAMWAQTEEPETEVPSAGPVEAITLFGVNFDLTTSKMKKVLLDRFACNKKYIEKPYSDCTPLGGGEIIDWELDTLGDFVSISFKCEIFNGCTYTPSEVFSNLRERFKLVGDVKTRENSFCDNGVAGELICVSKNKQNRITLYREKFRQKPISFD